VELVLRSRMFLSFMDSSIGEVSKLEIVDGSTA